MSIGLVELPYINLMAPDGVNWMRTNKFMPLVSKQILLASLKAGGFDAQMVNLKEGNEQEEYGTVNWRGRTHRKILEGTRISSLDPNAHQAWGITVNFMRQREAACMAIQHLSRTGTPVVVGGSEAIGDPQTYLQAGATAVVTDKSGAANWSVFDFVLGSSPREQLTGVILADGSRYSNRIPPLSPEDWALPSLDIVKQCLGTKFLYSEESSLLPQGSVFADLGCDRKCDFCMTPTYRLGYKRMTPQKTLQWFALQKESGARSVQSQSDQFLGRVLFPEGRQEILGIVNGLREMELPVLWVNGLELKKATLGRGIRPDGDATPDEELVEAVWGWDGKVGCAQAYIPAERPFMNQKSYAKLLPWEQHLRMLRTIVHAGVPSIHYGVIVGLPDDSHESLLYLEEAILDVEQELKSINPLLEFQVMPFAVGPFIGTRQRENLKQLGLIRFDDPIVGAGFWTASCDTHHLSYEEVSDWQMRLLKIGDKQLQTLSISN